MAAAGTCAITFQVRAETSFGDSLVLVGSGSTLGDWDPQGKGVILTTTPEDYPLWKTAALSCQAGVGLEYKYVRLDGEGGAQWESDGANRLVPPAVAKGGHIVVDDGSFGHVQPECIAFPVDVNPSKLLAREPKLGGPHLFIVGDAVAAGHGVSGFKGWTSKLVAALHAQFGFGCSARVGDLDVHKALQDFPQLLGASSKPGVVLLAFSAGLEHVATCPDWDRAPTCASYLGALEGLVQKVFEAGAYPVIAGLCPNGNSSSEETTQCWRETNEKMKQFGVPVLDWLHTLVTSHHDGRWAEGLSQDPARPNAQGHDKMLAAVDLSIFQPSKAAALLDRRTSEVNKEKVCFTDGSGFQLSFVDGRGELTASNTTKNEYQLNAGWGTLQDSLAAAKRESPWSMHRGLYVAYDEKGACTSAYLDAGGRLASGEAGVVPAGGKVVMQSVKKFSRDPRFQIIFEAGPLSILHCKATGSILILNEADFEYNVHPMWNDARLATRKVPRGIYEDDSGRPFRTAILSVHGLQSRIKVPAASALSLKLTGSLDSLERVALLPLGDRCSIRMLLHKIELDGPCYPFDLTRTTSLADVADMVGSGFEEMWREELLHYDHDAGRIFHKKWGGLSYAHEVDDGDDPVNNFQPVAARMAKRYGGRSARFDYAVNHADRVLFLRTGCSSRGEVENFLQRAHSRYPGIKAKFLLISDQPSHEFQGMPEVVHVCEAFDPDRMYEDMNYWVNCAHQFRGILERHGITARNLYWCPNNLKEAEKELREAETKFPVPTPPLSPAEAVLMTRDIAKFSHSNLYDLEKHGGVGA